MTTLSNHPPVDLDRALTHYRGLLDGLRASRETLICDHCELPLMPFVYSERAPADLQGRFCRCDEPGDAHPAAPELVALGWWRRMTLDEAEGQGRR